MIDYRQFYLWDSGKTNQAPERYTSKDVERRIKTGKNVVVLMPERNNAIPVTVEIHDQDPGYKLQSWDHIAEASLSLPTGQLQVHECLGGPVWESTLQPGWYRVRFLAKGLKSVDELGLDGRDKYLVSLWPQARGKVQVLKQWTLSF